MPTDILAARAARYSFVSTPSAAMTAVRRRLRAAVIAFAAMGLAASGAVASTTFTTLHEFVTAEGTVPYDGLTQGSDGTLYGTCYSGGNRGTGDYGGTVFKLQPDGTGFTVLHKFNGVVSGGTPNVDGSVPQSAPLLNADGYLYGITYQGGTIGYGVFYRVKPDGTGFSNLKNFDYNSNSPEYTSGGLIRGNDGLYYGMGSAGGSDSSMIFKIDTTGTSLTRVTAFTYGGTTGSNAGGWLLQGSDGNLYGMASGNGSGSAATIYRVATDGTALTVLHNFTAGEGQSPWGGLIQGGDGMLYGVTSSSAGAGTVYKIKPDGTGFTVLHSLSSSEGSYLYYRLLLASDGMLYGSASGGGANGYGSIFQVKPDGTNFSVVYNFTGGTDHRYPNGNLIQGLDGRIYGTASDMDPVSYTPVGTGCVFALTSSSSSMSSNADLSALTLDAGTLAPAFASGTTSYTASVAYGTTSVNVTPTLSDSTATVKVNNQAVTSGNAKNVALSIGSNTLTTVVTAQDGTTKTYTVTVTRAAASSNADLSNLTISAGTLSPVFAAGTSTYTATVSSATSSIDVTPTVADSTATLTVNGAAVASGNPASVSLNFGSNIITVVDTAQDGATIKTYTLTVTRVTNIATLSAVTISSGTLSPTFASGTTSYAATVAHGTSGIIVTPTVTDSNATVAVNGVSTTSGDGCSLLLNSGNNSVTIVVTAQDGSTKTYTLTITVSAVVPGAPTIGTVTPGDTQASVSFTPPGDNGGATITGYTVTASPGGATGTGSVSPITVTGLTNGVSYTFTVTATNSAGTGSASAASNSVTPNPGPTVVSVTVPANGAYAAGANLDLVVTWDSNTTVTGTPRIALVVGSTTVYANYLSSPNATTTLFRYTVQSGESDPDGIAIGALTLNGGTIQNGNGTDATLTLNSVGSTAAVLVDGIAPTVSDAAISISGASGVGGVFKVGDTVTATWDSTAGGDNNPDIAGVAVDFSRFGGGTSVSALNTAGVWTATYTITSGTIDAANRNVVVTATDSAGNTTTTADTTNASVDNMAATVTDAAISISGASGAGGGFKIGDTITATWNNSASGDNNSDALSSVTVDFSQFGGGSAVAATNSAGVWSATYTITAGAIDAANRNVSIMVTDDAGNTRTATDTTEAAVDNVAPTVSDAAISISGASGTGGVYRIGDTVTVTWNNSAAGDNNADLIVAATVDFSGFGGGAAVPATSSAGVWTATYTIVAGSIDATNRNVVIAATDNAGNTSTASDTTNASVDNIAPAAPSQPDLASASDTGASSTDNVTNATAPTFTGTAETGSTVKLYAGATLIGSGAATDGTWSITASTLTAGTHSITAVDTDDAGNIGPASSPLSITIDTAAPTIEISAIASDDRLNAAEAGSNLSISGTTTADDGRTVTVGFIGQTYTGTAASGAWSVTIPSTALGAMLSDGAKTVTADVSDPAGNSATQATRTLTVDQTAPALPVFTAISDDTGSSSTDQITSDATLILSGTAEANSTVTVSRVGTGVIGTATANSSGAWSFDYTGTTLGTGTHSFTATATDTAGNTSSVSSTFFVTVDSTTAAPVITTITTDSGANTTDGITNDATLVISGTAEKNGTVSITRTGAGVIGTATADSSGAWAFDYTGTTLPDATYLFTATVTDPAGNTSASSADFPVTIDTTAPDAPAITAIDTDTGSSNSDRITSDPALTLSGTAEANATIAVSRLGMGLIGTATAGSDDKWSLDYTGTILAEGDYTFTATATDAAGNTSSVSADFAVTVDTTAPTITSAATASATYRSTFTYAVTATGSATSYGATGLPAGLSIDSATGAISGQPTQSGSFTVALTATDAAGNIGSGTLTLTVGQVTLTISGITATNKTYDASLTATLNTTAAALDGVANGDDVALSTTSASGAFADKTAGSGKTVTVSGLTLTGADAAHYTLVQPTTTATITTKPVTVTGITAANKVYDGTAAATLGVSSATLGGVILSDDVTLVTGGAVGAFSNVNAGNGKSITVSGLTLAGTDAANYSLVAPTLTANITQAAATVVLGAMSATYDGAAKPVSVTTTPSVTTTITYAGSAIAPVNAGSYAVVATVTDPNYAGSATGTLVIAKASQSVSFPTPTNVTIGSPVPLNAAASTALPVAYAIVSGPGSISGSMLTVTSAGTVVVRATQAGNANYNPASADVTIANIAKLSQTISFGTLEDKRATDAASALGATASSGLPVSFTVVSGPALVEGSTLTLSGAPGLVTVRASQAGNATYSAAADVTRTFTVAPVGPLVYFGNIASTAFAATVNPDGKSGTMIGTIPGTGEGFVVNFTPGTDGGWTATVTTFTNAATATTADDGVAVAAYAHGEPSRAAAQVTRTFRGIVSGATLTGTIDGLNLTFTAQLVPPTGPTEAIAGYYQSSSLETATGSIYSMVGTQNQVYVLAVTPTYVGGSTGTATTSGTFTADLGNQVSVNGAVDAPSTTVTGTLSEPSKAPEAFAGISVATVRTDRLLNLSSRARVTSGVSDLITGFVIGGSAPKTVLLRAVGPTLSDFGVQGALAGAKLRLFDAQGRVLREVQGWNTDAGLSSTFSRVGAFGLKDANTDSALLTTLAPGQYTMQVIPAPDANGNLPAAGVAMAEIYDASANPQAEYQRLVNISSRGHIDSGEGVLIGGFVVNGNAPKRLLIRGVGPSLSAFKIGDALANPVLTVYSGDTVVARNDDWSTPVTVTATQVAATPEMIAAATQQVGAFGLPSGSRDAAVIVTLAPGSYTAVVGSADSKTGTGLIEVYEIPNN